MQSVWLLLAHCILCVVWNHKTHDLNMRQCVSQIVQVNLEEADQEPQDSVTVPLSLGEECSTDVQGCLLGQLDRLLGHDQRTTPIDEPKVKRFRGEGVDWSVRF